MTKYASIKKSVDEELLQLYDAELQLMATEYMDTFTPAVVSMEAVQIVLQMMIELSEHVGKKGKSEKAEKSFKRLKKLFEIVNKLNTITGDNATLKLRIKEAGRLNYLLKKENQELKNDIQKMKDAEAF